MANYLSPGGVPIVGTLERLSGRANLSGIDPETQEPEYTGDTTIWWEKQKTVHRNGKPIFVDEDGGEWTFDQLVLETDGEDEEDDDGCPKGDPECLGNNGDCHDACEGQS